MMIQKTIFSVPLTEFGRKGVPKFGLKSLSLSIIDLIEDEKNECFWKQTHMHSSISLYTPFNSDPLASND
jgi:hypothetical protein